MELEFILRKLVWANSKCANSKCTKRVTQKESAPTANKKSISAFIQKMFLLMLLNQVKYILTNFRFQLDIFNGIGKPSAKTIISLTTSPERLKKGIHKTFSTFHPSVLKLLNLPVLFRNTESYSLEALKDLQKVPNLIVNWIPFDFGPQTKLLGSLHYKDLKNYENIIIIDDDTLYQNNLIELYDNAFATNQRGIYSQDSKYIHDIRIQEGWKSYGFKIIDLLENANDILFLNLKYSTLNTSCKFHDDCVLGAIFEDLSFKHIFVGGLYLPQQLLVGYASDALHLKELGIKKNYICSQAIWHSREMCLLPPAMHKI
jgi:hypothetical protein